MPVYDARADHEMSDLRAAAVLFAIIAASVAVSGCQLVARQPRVSGEVSVEGENARVQVVFGEDERRRIRDYYSSDKRLPPGLAKKQKLPPGLARQVERNGRLPPGLQGRPLPRELERRLPSLPDGYVRLRVGLDVVLMERDTRVVVDIVEDIGPS